MLKHLLPILFLAYFTPALAETPTDASLGELLELTHQDNMVNTYRAVLNSYSLARVAVEAKTRKLTDAQRETLEQSQAKATEITSRLVTWETIRPALMDLYRDKLSQEQVTQVVLMLKSPAWKVFSESVTPIQTEASLGAVQIATRMYPKIEEEINHLVTEILASGKGKT
jgi:transposase